MMVLSGIFAFILAVAHALTAYLRFIHLTPRSRWLSFASGVSIAFIALKLLPYLAKADEVLGGNEVRYVSYSFLLGGLVLFYGLEVAVRRSRRREDGPGPKPSRRMFILHLGAFAGYNALMGAMLVDVRDEAISQQTLFVLALVLHNVVNDFALREHHMDDYERFGRWVLAAAVIAGWSAATFIPVPDQVFYAIVAVLIGAITLNVLKDELPAERDSRFGAFLAGCLAFAILWFFSGL